MDVGASCRSVVELAGGPMHAEIPSGRLTPGGFIFVAVKLRLDIRDHVFQPKQPAWVPSDKGPWSRYFYHQFSGEENEAQRG